MRERLKKLILENDILCHTCGENTDSYCAEYLADHLLENGIIVTPCKVGQTVYTNFAMRGWYYRDKDRPYSAKVVFIGLNNSKEMGGGLFNVAYNKDGNMLQFKFSDIGKTVFLSREEAEQALKGAGS